jgi:hypothetical protein
MLKTRNPEGTQGMNERRKGFGRKAVRPQSSYALRKIVLIMALASPTVTPCFAAEFDTGSPDLQIRWDNTARYNIGMRVQSIDPAISADPVADEGTNSFGRNHIVTNRVDLLSELDVVFEKRMGFRVSGAGWYDNAYDGKHPTGNPNLLIPNLPGTGPFPPLRQAFPNGGQLLSYDNSQYSPYIKRYYAGPSGELLDAFVFDKFNLGDVPVNVKVGRHTEYWGESLLLGGVLHGISYSQMPLDLQKAFATPGAEAKELFRPLGNVSAQAQLTPELSVVGQYFFQWESMRYPEGGTYLGPVDFAFNGPDRQIATQQLSATTLAILNLARAQPLEPKQTGEWGLATRWSPQWLDGTLGLYYRQFADKLPQALITGLDATHPFYANKIGAVTYLGLNGQYQLLYPDKIDLYGVSLSKNIGGVSWGAELSYRHNTPLLTQIFGNVAGQPLTAGNTPGARGDTMHGVLNALGVLPKTALFDTASYQAELTWNTYTKVNDAGSNLFQAEGYPLCNPGGPIVAFASAKDSGCATRNYFGLGINFTPTWFSVIPSGDLSLPMSWSQGISGNSSVIFGGNEGTGNYSIGVALDYQQRYRFDLKYVAFYGKTNVNPATGAVGSQNGFFALDKDRGFINLTFKTTF